MNNILRLEDFLRAYADVHGHTILNTQVLDVRMRCKERKPFALVIGRTCGVRIQEIDFKHYHKSMTSLRHSLDQHRTVLLFCLPGPRMQRLSTSYEFVRMIPEHFSQYYAMMDPVKVAVKDGCPIEKKESINLSAECRKTLLECVDYLNNHCMRTERQKPKKKRCNGHGFQRTYAANELMSRY